MLSIYLCFFFFSSSFSSFCLSASLALSSFLSLWLCLSLFLSVSVSLSLFLCVQVYVCMFVCVCTNTCLQRQEVNLRYLHDRPSLKWKWPCLLSTVLKLHPPSYPLLLHTSSNTWVVVINWLTCAPHWHMSLTRAKILLLWSLYLISVADLQCPLNAHWWMSEWINKLSLWYVSTGLALSSQHRRQT